MSGAVPRFSVESPREADEGSDDELEYVLYAGVLADSACRSLLTYKRPTAVVFCHAQGDGGSLPYGQYSVLVATTC